VSFPIRRGKPILLAATSYQLPASRSRRLPAATGRRTAAGWRLRRYCKWAFTNQRSASNLDERWATGDWATQVGTAECPTASRSARIGSSAGSRKLEAI